MEFWHIARTFAEEAAKRTQELSIGSSKFTELVSETAKRSKEIAAEASKRADLIKSEASKQADLIKSEAIKQADLIKSEAIKRADHIKNLAEGISPSNALALIDSPPETQEKDLEIFGITEELRDFVKEITIATFQDFPLQDDMEISDVPTVSNVRQDLSEWQEKHANLVLSTVKEISKLRYGLCPRVMKERKFWRIYFILVDSHVAPYEKQYMEDIKLKSTDQVEGDRVKEPTQVGIISKPEAKEVNQQSKTSRSSTEQDLDVFLLGDPGDSDEDPDDDDGGVDDEFDKMVNSSDDEKEKL